MRTTSAVLWVAALGLAGCARQAVVTSDPGTPVGTDSDESVLIAELQRLRTAQEAYRAESGEYALSLAALDFAPRRGIQVDVLDATALGLTTAIDTASNASTAMGQIDAAIESVTSARSDFGAIQNRLESSIRNINITSENLSAANSRIRDVDVAQETSRMTSYQILQQAGVSMLAQANMTSSLAMALMG